MTTAHVRPALAISLATAAIAAAACNDDARRYATPPDDDVTGHDVGTPQDVARPDVAEDLPPVDVDPPDVFSDACVDDAGCVELPHGDGCGLLVHLEELGGLCAYGPCYRSAQLHRGGYVIQQRDGGPPMDGILDAPSAERLMNAFEAVDAGGLEDGYGPCCNETMDGSDLYLTFNLSGGGPRRIRVSDGSAPAELLALVDLLRFDTVQIGWLGVAVSPVLAGVPFPMGPVSTCDNAEELGVASLDFRLLGPAGQIVSPVEVRLAPPPSGNFTLTFEGELTLDDMGRVAVADSSGALWSVWMSGAGVEVPGLYAGQHVRLVVTGAQSFAGYRIGAAVFGDRGLVFAIDGGLTNLAEAANLPFSVAVVDVGCVPVVGGCSPQAAEGLRFVSPQQEVVLKTSEWGALAAPGYDLAILNLQSFSTGMCDDYGHYGYIAYAIAGSDRGVCSLEPEPQCATDADCTQAIDCCTQQFVCHPVDEPIITCDMDCDPPMPGPPCLCQHGTCQNSDVCQQGLGRFESCGYDLETLAGSPDYALLTSLRDGVCDENLSCYAECLANPTEDECFGCHFGPGDCLRDPLGECWLACAP